MNQKPVFGKSWNWKLGNNFYRPGLGYGGTPQMTPSIGSYPNISPSSYAPPGGWSVPLSIDGQEYIEQKTISSRPTVMQTITGDPYKPFGGVNKWATKKYVYMNDLHLPFSLLQTHLFNVASNLMMIVFFLTIEFSNYSIHSLSIR